MTVICGYLIYGQHNSCHRPVAGPAGSSDSAFCLAIKIHSQRMAM